jgi:hypothetical protein
MQLLVLLLTPTTAHESTSLTPHAWLYCNSAPSAHLTPTNAHKTTSLFSLIWWQVFLVTAFYVSLHTWVFKIHSISLVHGSIADRHFISENNQRWVALNCTNKLYNNINIFIILHLWYLKTIYLFTNVSNCVLESINFATLIYKQALSEKKNSILI